MQTTGECSTTRPKLPPEATSPAALKAWTSKVAGEVVDHALDVARVNRQRAAAEAAERREQEARDQARAEESRRRREEIEAADAQKLLDERRAEADRQERRAALVRAVDGSFSVSA